MIAALAAGLALSGPTVLVLPNPNASLIDVQAIVSVGTLTSHEQALAQVVRDTLLDATADFNEDDLRHYSALAGSAMRCTLSADHYRIELEMPKGQLDLAGQIMCDVLQHPRFDDSVIQAELQALPFRRRSYWSEALYSWNLDYSRINQPAVEAFFQRVFTPNATTIVISGPIGQLSDDPTSYWPRLANWNQPKPDWRKDYSGPTAPLSEHAFPITTAELYSSEYDGSDASFPLQLLVATALGAGKGSAMHRVLREQLALTYLQQAVVTPTANGFRTRLFLIHSPSGEDSSLCETARKALLEDVKSWSAETLERAIGMAQAYLLAGAEATPLYLDASSPLTQSPQDQAFLAGYWKEKTGNAWDARKLLGLMKQVTLGNLKSTAEKLLTDAQTRVIPGKT